MKKKYISPIIKIQYMQIEESILTDSDCNNNDILSLKNTDEIDQSRITAKTS